MSTAATVVVQQEITIVRFDGPRLLDESGVLLAELAADGNWYTLTGARCTGLMLPALRVKAQVTPAEAKAARRAADAAWMASALKTLSRLAETQATLTGDDVWAALEMPPRESRMIGNALARARAAGLIEPTSEHRPSSRVENHFRPIRVWRSVRYGQQHIC